MALGVAQVHPQQLGGEELRLVAARAGPDLQDHALLVVGVARQQQHAEPFDQLGLARLQPSDLVLGQVVHLLVARVAHLQRLGQLLADRAEVAPGGDDGLDLGHLLAQALERGRVRRRLGLEQLGVHGVVLGRDLDELGVDHEAASGRRPAGAERLRPHRQRPARQDGAALRDLVPVCDEGVLERHERDFDHVVAGLAGGDHLDPDPRRPQPAHQGVAAVTRAELQQLVADGGDHGNQDDARDDQPHRRQLADDRERQDRDDQDDDEELGAAARMSGGVLAGRRHGQRIAGLESVDRHVLGAVVLERTPHVRRPRHQQQIADEDDDPDQALGELQPEALIHATDGRLGQEERQQEEDPHAEGQRDNEHAADRDGVALAQAFLCTGRLWLGRPRVRIRVARAMRFVGGGARGTRRFIGGGAEDRHERQPHDRMQQRPGRAAHSPGRTGRRAAHSTRALPLGLFRGQGLESCGANEPARPGDEGVVQHHQPANERQAHRPTRAQAEVEPFGGPDDRTVGVPQGDRECMAAAHQDALD